MNAITEGLYKKFTVTRNDGRSAPGAKHADCEHFVLDLTHDKHALPALAAYAESCKTEYPQLAADLRTKATAALTASNIFVTVPAVTLRAGLVIPSFQVGQFLCSRGPMGVAQINGQAAPWVSINYEEARAACVAAGGQLLTELQALAIAHDIAYQDINWTGGKVGEGKVYQGLHKGNVDEAQPGDYVSDDPEERRWHQLSNGERVYDFAGNAYSWIFDNVQGDTAGLVASSILLDSPSLTTARYPSMEKGMGWRPASTAKWSGHALIRGGCWRDGDGAGVFYLLSDWPGNRYDYVAFRCTK